MEKVKCIWCNTVANKEDMSVIYGKNSYFNKAIFYGCKGEHITSIKNFLEKTEKYYSHTQATFLLTLVIYPLLVIFLKKYFHLITILITLDFGSGLFLYPFGAPAMTEKIGIKNAVFIIRIIASILIIAASALAYRVWFL